MKPAGEEGRQPERSGVGGADGRELAGSGMSDVGGCQWGQFRGVPWGPLALHGCLPPLLVCDTWHAGALNAQAML